MTNIVSNSNVPYLVVANWKMGYLLSQAFDFCQNFVGDNSIKHENVIIAPPTPYLAYLADKFPTQKFAAQNISPYPDTGAYTGEYSAAMIKNSGINYTIIGHSERRNLAYASDSQVQQKALSSINAGVIPIVCIGEDEFCRSDGRHISFLEQQLEEIITPQLQFDELIIAYEPIWSIGTGKIPSQTELQEIFSWLTNAIKKISAKKIRLLYGGSVNLDNIAMILKVMGINGALIGSASLDISHFTSIVKYIQNSNK